MGQHVDIIAIIGDTDIVARFRVRQLRMAVRVSLLFSAHNLRGRLIDRHHIFDRCSTVT